MANTDAPSTVRIPLSGGGHALINADDLDRELFCEFRGGYMWRGRIGGRKWKKVKCNHTDYVVCCANESGTLHDLRLHRVVLCARAGDIVDHVDGNGLNCTRTNLRFVSKAGNTYNSRSAGGTSRFKGVSFHRQANKWQASIGHKLQKTHLGLFTEETEAARAYDAKARELFGECALLNNV